MYHHLQKYYPNTKPQLLISSYGPTTKTHNESFMFGVGRSYYCTHSFVSYELDNERVYVDCNGNADPEYSVAVPPHKIPSLLNKLGNPFEWNELFNRRHITKILRLGELPSLKNLAGWKTLFGNIPQTS